MKLIEYINLIVIRAPQIEKTKAFYELLGMEFIEEKHGRGPLHFAATLDRCVFEIYPGEADTNIRLGFCVKDIANAVEKITNAGYQVAQMPKKSKWGIRGVVIDPDGRTIELCQKNE